MKILLVHTDPQPWASHNRAEALKEQWIEDEVDIAYCKELPDGDKYDIIHFLYSGGLSKRKEFIWKYRNKVFTSLASHRTLDERFDKLANLIEIYKNTVCCVAQSLVLADKLKELIKQDNVVYIPNGIDEKFFNRPFVVGFVGAKDSEEHKGLPLIKQACNELGLELKVLNSGYIYKTMSAFYNSIDCLILASLSEGCNNPTLEALAMNKPVISTDVGIANKLEGVILVERNVESIKKALRKVSGRIQILENYTWAKIAQNYKKIYEQYLIM